MRGILSIFLLVSGVLSLGYFMGFESIRGAQDSGQVMYLDEGVGQLEDPITAMIDLSNDGPLAELTLSVAEIEQEIARGVSQLFWVFYRPGETPQYPSPTIVVKEGQRVRISFQNDTHYVHHTIHLHGVNKPWHLDGVPEIEQHAVAPGSSFIYEFEATNPGTHWYHCHVQADKHVEMGLMGAFIILPENNLTYESFSYNEYGADLNSIGNYDRDYVLILDDIDQDLHERIYNNITFPMMDHGSSDAHGEAAHTDEQATHDEHQESVEMPMGHEMNEGVQHVLGPHLVKQHMIEEDGIQKLDSDFNHIHHMAMIQIVNGYDSTKREPRFYTVNGLSFPYSLLNSPIVVKQDELIKLRLINASFEPVSFHLHGHEAVITHYDGYKDPFPLMQDTILIPAAGRVDLAIRADKEPGVWVIHDHSAQRVTNGGLYPGGMIAAIVYEEVEIAEIPNELMCSLIAEVLEKENSPCLGKSEYEMGPFVGLGVSDVPTIRSTHRLR